MFIEYSKLVYFTNTDILESLATVRKPYKIGVKVYKTTWSWLHFIDSVLLYRHECFTGKYTTRKIHKNYIRDPSGLCSIISHVSLSMT